MSVHGYHWLQITELCYDRFGLVADIHCPGVHFCFGSWLCGNAFRTTPGILSWSIELKIRASSGLRLRTASIAGKASCGGSVSGSSAAKEGCYAPIAWINGRIPMMFMTRVKL